MKIFFKILFSWMGSLFPYIWLFLMLSFSILFANDNTRTNNNNIDFNFSFLREIEFDSISSTKGFFIDEVSYTFSDGFLGSMPKIIIPINLNQFLLFQLLEFPQSQFPKTLIIINLAEVVMVIMLIMTLM